MVRTPEFIRAIVKVYRTSKSRQLKVKTLTLLNDLLKQDKGKSKSENNLPQELANLGISLTHVTDLHTILAMVESEKNYDGYLNLLI